MYIRLAPIAFAAVFALSAQEQPEKDGGWKKAETPDAAHADDFVIPPGTKVPLSMINSISTKTASEGERIYLETVFPILANGRVVIPPGSYVAGTVTDVKRPGRMHGRAVRVLISIPFVFKPNAKNR